MAVSIDTVYQRVLAIANKEQRGYITPQEFNLMADRVQKEVYDSYFHDFKTLDMKPTKDLPWADEMELLQEKLGHFSSASEITITGGSAGFTLPINTYKIISVVDKATGNPIEEMSIREIKYIEQHPLTKATKNRMVWVRDGMSSVNQVDFSRAKIYPQPDEDLQIVVDFYMRPRIPKWGYVVINEKPLYNANTSHDFQLHASEENIITAKMLALFGVIINKQELIAIGDGMEQGLKQSQND